MVAAGFAFRKRWRAILGICLIAAAGMGQTAPSTRPARGGELTDKRVLEAVQKGVDYLFVDADKHLEKAARGVRDNGAEIAPNAVPEALGDEAGELMLEAYALFYAGRELRTPALNLRDQRIGAIKEVVVGWNPPPAGAGGDYQNNTYTTALQVLALSQLPHLPEVEAAMRRASQRLITGMSPRGGYSYRLPPQADPDQSDSQYGLLGVWAAADWGVSVPPSYWQTSSVYWRRTQAINGGWGYQPGFSTTPAMTAAGLGSLYICSEFTDRSARLDAPFDAAIERGLAALTSTFDPANNDLYYLYALERVSLAGGHKYLGTHDWYRETVPELLQTQQEDGSFNSEFTGYSPGRATAFAILYLLRGRGPVLMNKLEYEGAWNLRPRDSANVHAVLSATFERRLNWQIVPLAVPPEEWLDAPILLITGTQDPGFDEAQVAKLRAYVQQGGMIFSVAAGRSTVFSKAMQRYAGQLVADAPVGETPASAAGMPAWRELPGSHVLFKGLDPNEPLPRLMGMTNGVREIWIHCDADLSAQWQNRVLQKPAWDIPARLFLYMAGKEGLRSRLQIPGIPDPETPPAMTIGLARLQFPGNWDPEPGAWPRMGKLLALEAHTTLAIQPIAVENLGRVPRAQRPSLAHLAGTGHLALSEPAMRSLRDYVQNGGTLFIEAIGGDPTFAKEGRELVARLFPGSQLRPIPPGYVLYKASLAPSATAIGAVEYRRVEEAGPMESGPRLEFVTVNNRLGIIYSDQDLTHGLLNLETAGITGYKPASAQALARNILLFAAINLGR